MEILVWVVFAILGLFAASYSLNKKISSGSKIDPDRAHWATEAGKLAMEEGDYRVANEHFLCAINLDPTSSNCQYYAGLITETLDDLDTAIKHYEKALSIDLKNLDSSAPEIASDWNNLGLAWKKKGDFDKALEFFEKALAGNIQNFGLGHHKVAVNWNNIAGIYGSKGDYDKALGYYEKVLDSELKNFGENHPHVANARGNIGSMWGKKRNYFESTLHLDKNFNVDEAIRHTEKALTSDIKTYGKNHPKLLGHINSLSAIYYKQGNLSKSKEYLEKALNLCKSAGLESKIEAIEDNIRFIEEEMSRK